MAIKRITVEVEKWYVCGLPRNENGTVSYKDEVVLSQGYNTREMAEIECRIIRQTIDNRVMYVGTRIHREKVVIEKRYESGYDYDCKLSRIYDAYNEYRRCEEW